MPNCYDQSHPNWPGGLNCNVLYPDDDAWIPCYFCNVDVSNPVDNTPPKTPCLVSTGRCSGQTGSPPMWLVKRQPFFRINYAEGCHDAKGNTDEFHSTAGSQWSGISTDGKYRAILQPECVILIEPCVDTGNYCGGHVDPYHAVWLCRWFLVGVADGPGWEMHCNDVEAYPPGENPGYEDQYVGKEQTLKLDIGTQQLGFVHLIAGFHRPHCFSFQDQFCFEETSGSDDVPVVGTTYPQIPRMLDWLEFDADLWYSVNNTRYPHTNAHTIELKNAALGTLCGLMDRLESPGHAPSAGYASKSVYTWGHAERFENDGEYPVVKGIAQTDDRPGAYTDYLGAAVPITVRSWLTSAEFPAVLTIERVGVTLHLHVEQKSDENQPGAHLMRVQGDLLLAAKYRVKLLPAAYDVEYAYSFADPDDPYNLAIDDEYEVLTAFGPNGERVPRILTWRGLKTTMAYSHGPNSFDDIECNYPIGHGHCCEAMQAIHDTELFGELNDCWGGHYEQRYHGSARLRVPDINSGGSQCRCIG